MKIASQDKGPFTLHNLEQKKPSMVLQSIVVTCLAFTTCCLTAHSVRAEVVLSGGGLTLVEQGGVIAPDNLSTGANALAFAKDLLLIGGNPVAPHQIPHLNDGVYGNSNSWIGNSLDSYAGISLGNVSEPISSIAFGRDNLGTFGDRNLGLYTLQFTTDLNPHLDPEAAAWSDIGTLDYQSPGSGNFSAPQARHRYNFDTVDATGIRLFVPGDGLGSGTAIDEIELYAIAGEIVEPPGPIMIAPEAGFAISWDGSDGDFFDEAEVASAPDNIALASNGSTAFGSTEFGAGVHLISNINDGRYGNSNSWISDFRIPDPNPYVALDFGGSVDISRVAWGRDNGNNVADACGGQCTDRSLGVYTLQFTNVAAPGTDTAETGDDANGWQTIGTLSYDVSSDLFTPYLRHQFNVSLDGAPISATGFRILVSNPNIAIDELEINSVPEPSSVILLGIGLLSLFGLVKYRHKL